MDYTLEKNRAELQNIGLQNCMKFPILTGNNKIISYNIFLFICIPLITYSSVLVVASELLIISMEHKHKIPQI